MTSCYLAGKDASSEITESTAIFLFDLLRKTSFVTKNDLSKIAETFGPCDRSFVEEAYKLIQLLVSNIPEEELNKKLESSGKSENEHVFGKGIKFTFPEPVEFEADLSMFDEEIKDKKPKFSLKLNVESSKAVSVRVAQEHYEERISPINCNGPGNISWLKQKCDIYFGDAGENLNSADMCSVIFDLLCSSRPNQEMQNELFELLGFDRFEFIEELLSNRQKIVAGGTKSIEAANGSKGIVGIV